MSRFDDDVDGADVMRDDEFADVRAALGLAVPPVEPSAALKSSVMAAIASTLQLSPVADVAADESADTCGSGSPAERRANARWFSRPVMLVTAAAAAVAVFFGGVLAADLVRPVESSATEQLAAIVAAPDVSTLVSPVAGGASATLVSSESVGLSAMVFEGLRPLSDDERYALWYITDGVPTPAGLFAVDEGQTVVQVLEGVFEAGTIVGVTVEPASGSPAPTTDPIVAIATA